MGSERQVRRLAETLVRHSVKAKKGEIVRISTGELGRPLALEVFREVLRAGAAPLPSVRVAGAGRGAPVGIRSLPPFFPFPQGRAQLSPHPLPLPLRAHESPCPPGAPP